MYCYLDLSFISDNKKSVIETIDWFHSIGANWISEKHDDMPIDIEFINVPTLLKATEHLQRLSVTRISDEGVTFYLFDWLSPKESIEFDFNCPDGIVFVPMSNIKSINTLGNVKGICVTQ